MAAAIHQAASGPREPRIEKRPWARITREVGQRNPVTLWIGLNAIVASVVMPGVEPYDLRITVHGMRLSLQGPAGTGVPGEDIDLPYAVDVPPLLVKDGADTIYILLQRK